MFTVRISLQVIMKIFLTLYIKNKNSKIKNLFSIFYFFYFRCNTKETKINNQKNNYKREKPNMVSRYSEVDKGYAFVILTASFLAHVLQYGVVWTVGVFFAIFVEVFPENSGIVALISSLNTAFYYGAGKCNIQNILITFS